MSGRLRISDKISFTGKMILRKFCRFSSLQNDVKEFEIHGLCETDRIITLFEEAQKIGKIKIICKV